MCTCKPLQLSELSVRQKLGMAMTAHVYNMGDDALSEANLNYALDMVRNHSLGAIWVDSSFRREEVMARIQEAADYPILIFTDAESGFPPYLIGRHNALSTANSEELAYIFGKVTAVAARKAGYNVVCNPVLDMCKENAVCGKTTRSMGGDKYKVAKLAIAEAQGMRDGGVLIVGKHYPSACGDFEIDPHMAECTSFETEADLLDYNLYPYLELHKRDLLDGIMTQHCRFPNIDPDYPASLSEKVIGIIRRQGFDGFTITDALVMMGTAAKFGAKNCKGMAIGNGNDLALTWYGNKESFEAISECYEKGLITDQRLDDAVRHVLNAQEKSMRLPTDAEITSEDLEKFRKINTDGVCARIDSGLPDALDRQGRHYFVVMTENSVEISDAGKVNVDTLEKGWYQPGYIMQRLQDLFPNSETVAINQFPSPVQNVRVLENSVTYEDVIFVTFTTSQAYVGRECLTSRIVSVIQAMQITDQVSTIVHFGNPFVLEELPHIPRILMGGISADAVDATLNVLAGLYPAKGTLPYPVKLQ